MTRIRLHRTEQTRDWTRIVGMAITVVLFGFFAALLVRMVAASADSFTTLALHPATGGFAEAKPWAEDIPVALALLLIPGLAALTVGANTVHHGGILGFFISLFNLLPLPISNTQDALLWSQSQLIWPAFIMGAILAFYLGDVGSWLCRRRLLREAKEDIAFGMIRGEILPAWDEDLPLQD